MKINAYKIVEEPTYVYAIKKEGQNTDELKLKFINYLVIENSKLIVLVGNREALYKIDKRICLIEYNSLSFNQKIQYLKMAFSKYSQAFGYIPVTRKMLLDTSVSPKLTSEAYINSGINYRIEYLGNEFYIVISPKNIITEDGERYNPIFAKQKSSELISLLAINYYEFCKRINVFVQKIGNSIDIEVTNADFLKIEIANEIESENLFLIREPLISFGGGRTHTFPAYGLNRYFPLDYNETVTSRPSIIDSAYIGTSSIGSFLKVLQNGNNKIKSFSDIYKCRLKFPKECSFVLSNEEIVSCKTITDVTNILKRNAIKIKESTKQIRLCIIELPEEWEEFFVNQEQDLHDTIKVDFYMEGIPTQIITSKAIKANGKSTFENLRLGIYVTAGGKPWKLSEQFRNKVFIGISFGKVVDNKTRLIGVAEIFDEYGQTISMKCMSVKEIEKEERFSDKDIHLSYEAMQKTVISLLTDYYDSHKKSWPEFVVIHKTSYFDLNEKKALDELSEYPFKIRTIHIYTGQECIWNVITGGKEPKRGQVCKISQEKALVYTSGILQNFDNYFIPGMPLPLLIEDESVEKDIDLTCEEIIKLTKLNWNSTNSYEKFPVTISHSRKIVNLLRAGLDIDNPIDLRFFL